MYSGLFSGNQIQHTAFSVYNLQSFISQATDIWWFLNDTSMNVWLTVLCFVLNIPVAFKLRVWLDSGGPRQRAAADEWVGVHHRPEEPDHQQPGPGRAEVHWGKKAFHFYVYISTFVQMQLYLYLTRERGEDRLFEATIKNKGRNMTLFLKLPSLNESLSSSLLLISSWSVYKIAFIQQKRVFSWHFSIDLQKERLKELRRSKGKFSPSKVFKRLNSKAECSKDSVDKKSWCTITAAEASRQTCL